LMAATSPRTRGAGIGASRSRVLPDAAVCGVLHRPARSALCRASGADAGGAADFFGLFEPSTEFMLARGWRSSWLVKCARRCQGLRPPAARYPRGDFPLCDVSLDPLDAAIIAAVYGSARFSVSLMMRLPHSGAMRSRRAQRRGVHHGAVAKLSNGHLAIGDDAPKRARADPETLRGILRAVGERGDCDCFGHDATAFLPLWGCIMEFRSHRCPRMGLARRRRLRRFEAQKRAWQCWPERARG
jgi:hypothetical protein